jgi:UDP-glucose 4-epimerase
MGTILVTGAGGYIGSVTAQSLQAAGESIVVLDDLARGHRGAIASEVPFYKGTIGDADLVRRICHEHNVTAVVHFAALAYVGESVTDPRRYFENNVAQGLSFLGALIDSGVKQIVFSSTCATYGEPEYVPINEAHPQRPTNPYGFTKLVFEHALTAYERAYGLRWVALRYFNACGAAGELGEDHHPETHLIPIVLETALGKRPHVPVLGDDYPTADGTAIRDYIHVLDLASAHSLALGHLARGGDSLAVNLGTGNGYSVKEIVEAARKVTGKEIPIEVAPRRPGDPARLVADARKAEAVLGWKPVHSDLANVLSSAWSWHLAHPQGYADR